MLIIFYLLFDGQIFTFEHQISDIESPKRYFFDPEKNDGEVLRNIIRDESMLTAERREMIINAFQVAISRRQPFVKITVTV